MMHKRSGGGNGGGKSRYNRGGGGNRGYQNRGRSNGGGNDSGNIQRQKHHSTQMREKYTGLAKDAQMNGDVVDMEYYLQHVEHYNRVLNEIAAIEGERFAERQAQQAAQSGDQQQQPSEGESQNEGEQGQSQAEGGQTQERPQHDRPQHQRRERGNYRNNRQENNRVAADSEVNPNANHAEIPLPSSVIPEIPTNG